jgi:hypothetical protein
MGTESASRHSHLGEAGLYFEEIWVQSKNLKMIYGFYVYRVLNYNYISSGEDK